MATFNCVNSNVQGSNTFLGSGSGNITLSGQFNVGIGSDTLNSLTTGTENVGIGYNVLTNNTTGSNNVCMGNITGTAITTGEENTIIGSYSASFLDTGDDNIIIGYLSGSNYTTSESDNIIIANGYAGTALDTGKIVIGVSGVQTTCTIAGITGVTPATAGAQVMLVDSNDQLGTAGAMTDGQLLIGSTGANPVVASLTAGANITITPGAGSISIAASGGGSSMTWQNASGSITLAPNNGYYVAAGQTAAFTLPPLVGTKGDMIYITASGSGPAAWTLITGGGMGSKVVIEYTTSVSNPFAGSTITPTPSCGSILLICTEDTANFKWTIQYSSATLAFA